MQSQAGDGKQIRIEIPDVGEVHLDKELIRYVMLNLLSNAIKFSPPASTITVRAFRKDKVLCIEVQDQGIGISRKDQEHLFERFFRGRNADNIQGTGLGLHIVERYVTLMEGEIKIQSELNKGTIISLLFENK
jgi:signal transduction histidine kinase